ncbi:DeoR/GlpR family DNA-binding transcription regulator [Cytobacillus dafuensis]|uniref:DeoR/GlpR transcriptional regulator n=1 Tax=Cytobacillus dafuensis TaxID=1742359 RepID=A0A5B8Z2B9_CYTDA|nr:DeoR/GlpR family DNA-binding transcription regulator [Cytobacillus dafuensis]QED47048.1 DeoR/GlpR transcriptional regulator [Cytobacillus dafuensis]
MLPIERKMKLLEQVNTTGKIEIDELAEQLNVSSMTIRRDLSKLEKDGKLVRTHGGAVSLQSLTTETPYVNKITLRVKEKRLIALEALKLIPEGASVFLDSGTTTLEIANIIKERNDLHIVTNDLNILQMLLHSPSNIICTGGNLQNGLGVFYGPHAEDLLRSINIDILFLGAHAIDIERGISAPTLEKAMLKKMMIKTAKQTWAVCDSSKFDKHSFAHVCNLSEINGIITDNLCIKEKMKKYENRISIIYAHGN